MHAIGIVTITMVVVVFFQIIFLEEPNRIKYNKNMIESILDDMIYIQNIMKYNQINTLWYILYYDMSGWFMVSWVDSKFEKWKK